MATVDDKVVAMSFESSKFESGVNATIRALDKLKSALSFPSAGKGLDQISESAKRVDLSHIGRAIDSIKSKFSALSIVGVTALANIVSRAVSAGINVVKAFTIDPIKAGFKNYETQINAVQTILANTGLKGKAGLDKVNSALKDLNTYANLTVYNFSEMAKNIGTFTAAGVDLKTSTASIKGIANLAALSGSNSQQASTAMYQLSQAIAANQVKLQDWNSVVNAGMGGKVFQKALFTTAEAMHTIKGVKMGETFDQWTAAGNTFRGSLKQGWINAKVLTQTLSNFTGDLTAGQLKAEGYTQAQIKLIQEQAKVAVGAATNIKTFTQLTEALKEEVATAYAAIFKTIFGNINVATKLFSKIHIIAEAALTNPIYALNKLLEDWSQLGGRKDLVDALKTAFKELGIVMKTAKGAYRDIFPATTGSELVNITKKFQDFVNMLKPSPATIEDLRRTFRGLFAILDIGKQILGGIFTVFGQVFGAVAKGGGSFLDLTGNLGDFLVKVDDALKKGNRLHDFFVGLGNVLAVPIHFIETLAGVIAGLFHGVDPKASGAFSNSMGAIGKALTPLKKLLDNAKQAWDNFTGGFSNAGVDLQKGVNAIVQLFANLGGAIAGAIQHTNISGIMVALQTGLIGGIFVVLRKFLKGGFAVNLGGGLFKSITESFEGLTGTLGAMQEKLKAKTLEEIAISIGILAASIIGLSLVDPKKLDSAMSGLTIAFGELLGAMKILSTIGDSTGFLKLPIIAVALGGLAFAVGILTLAVRNLSGLDLAGLAKGLAGVGALLGGLAIAAGPLSKSSAGLIQAGIGITAIAVAMKVLASAVKDFGSMNLATLAKGIGAVAASLGSIALASKLFPSGMVRIGLGLVEIAFGLKGIVGVVAEFGHMDLTVIGKGLLGVAGSIGAIGLAMRAMPPGMAAQAVGLVLVAHALEGIGKAVTSFGGMSLQEMAKGIGALALSLGVLAAAMLAMEGGIGGAAAITIAAAGLRLLAPAMESLGHQSWGEIAKGLIALAGAMGILGAASLLIEPAAPALLALSVAMLAIGGGIFLVGAGIALLGTGLAAIAVAGPAAIAILIKAIEGLVEAAPKIVESFISALVQIVSEIAKASPKIVEQLGLLLVSLGKAVAAAAPQIAKGFGALITAGVKIITDNLPVLIKAGALILSTILKGIANNIGLVLDGVTDIILHILSGIDRNINKLVQAGANLLAGIVRGIGQGFDILNTAGTQVVVRFVNTLSNNVNKLITAGANVIVNLVTGIASAGSRIVTAAASAIGKFAVALANASITLVDKGAQAVVNFLNGVAGAIRKYEPQIIKAGANIGIAIVQGIINGIGSLAGELASKVEHLVTSIPGKFLHALHIGSPSRVMYDIGVNIIQGLTNGMDENAHTVVKSSTDSANAVINTFKDTFQISSPSRVMYQIGKDVSEGFAKGLNGNAAGIQQAFTTLNDQLTSAMFSLRSTITSEQNSLDRLRATKKPDEAAIKKAEDALKQDQETLKQIMAAHTELNKTLSTQKDDLKGLADQYDAVSARLKNAQTVLATAIKTRNDAITQFSQQFDTLPSLVTVDANGDPVSPADQLAQYEKDMQSQAAAVGTFQSTLDQLRKLGLDDATYQKLLSDGTADQQFASQLLSGGKTAVKGLNKLDKQLATASNSLAVDAGKQLYQAGVDAAQGLVDGLASQEKKIQNQMTQLAKDMVDAMKKELKIKSPSEVFAEIGRFSSQGVAKGMSDSAYLVANAAEDLASTAVESMQSTLGSISDLLTSQIDTEPTITPVLDLTNVQAGAKQMNDLLTPSTIGAASFGQAANISATTASPSGTGTDPSTGTPSITFEQNNYSPESLSPIDIYRQTRNQLSQAKAMLAKV